MIEQTTTTRPETDSSPLEYRGTVNTGLDKIDVFKDRSSLLIGTVMIVNGHKIKLSRDQTSKLKRLFKGRY
jgi:hypothetical protein